jgi:hypothetical protein
MTRMLFRMRHSRLIGSWTSTTTAVHLGRGSFGLRTTGAAEAWSAGGNGLLMRVAMVWLVNAKNAFTRPPRHCYERTDWKQTPTMSYDSLIDKKLKIKRPVQQKPCV